MPRFFYIAKSLDGEEKTGFLEAKDKSHLSKILKEEGFLLIRADLEEKEEKKSLNISLPFISGVPLAEKLMFTRNLQVMISSGLALPRALEILARQSKSRTLKKALLDIQQHIIKGRNFSESLKAYPGIFSELFQNMVKVGEETGNLEDVLKVLSRQMERENELKSKIKGALVYPAVIILAMIGIGVLMLVMVVPKLAETFEELEIELPLTTQIVIGLGTFLAEQWLLAILLLIFLMVLGYLGLKTRIGRQMVDTVSLKLPILSPLIKKTNSAHTVRTLSSLINAGVPIVRSLSITSNTLSNVYYKKALLEASEKVRKGAKLSQAMETYTNIYPLIVLQMFKVGEETGETSGILDKLSDFFEEEITYATKNLASVIEPILMIIIGAAIGFFAISMVQPMYSMLGAI